MATLWDDWKRDSRDFTLGSLATFQPGDQPFSRNGTLGNMGMRGMQNAQQRLAALRAGTGFMLPENVSLPPLRPAAMDSGFVPPANVPLPPPRPAAPASGFVPPANVPLPPPRPADMSVRESFMQRLLGNPTQSNSMPVLMTPQGPTPSGAALPQQVNWGDPDNPADFFRASQALQGLLG